MKKFCLTLLLCLSYYVVTAGSFTVVNLTGTNYVGACNIYPNGVSSFSLDSLGSLTISNISYDFSTEIDSGKSYTLEITPSTIVLHEALPGNIFPAFGAGMGAGFMWFGFGWCLRLAKRIGDAGVSSSDF